MGRWVGGWVGGLGRGRASGFDELLYVRIGWVGESPVGPVVGLSSILFHQIKQRERSRAVGRALTGGDGGCVGDCIG